MLMKQLGNISQEMLRSHGIFLLDYDSEVFIWIGSKVPSGVTVDSITNAGLAVQSVHCKGRKRRDKISFSFVRQGFEPEVFKQAFPAWEPFPRVGLDDDQISEEESGSDSESEAGSDDSAKPGKSKKVMSKAAETEAGAPAT